MLQHLNCQVCSVRREFVTKHSQHGLTDTLGGAPLPVTVELADAARHPSEFIASVTVVLARGTIVVAIRGADEGPVGWWKKSRTSPNCK